MCRKVVKVLPYALEFVPYQYETQKLCEGAVEIRPWSLGFVSL